MLLPCRLFFVSLSSSPFFFDFLISSGCLVFLLCRFVVFQMYQTSQNDPQQQALHVDALDFEHRLAAEKELSKSAAKKFQSMCFDESSNFLVYPSMLGIKIVNIRMNKVC